VANLKLAADVKHKDAHLRKAGRAPKHKHGRIKVFYYSIFIRSARGERVVWDM
jgi:hypothetical protein